MFTSVDAFVKAYQSESGETLKVMRALTNDSLAQPVTDGHRTLGRVAWHLSTIIPEMFKYTGLQFQKVKKDDPMPSTADMTSRLFDMVSRELIMQVKSNWTDESLQTEHAMYGETWKRGFVLWVQLTHEIHHRGQMTVLMRQAGLRVPGVYGPAKEDWATMGMTPPEV